MSAPAAVALLLLAAPVPFPKARLDPASALRRMEGLWEVLTYETHAGNRLDRPERMFVRIEAGRWRLHREQGGGLVRVNDLTLLLDPKRSPAWMDWQSDGQDRPYLHGLYGLSGDTMRVVFLVQRKPTDRPESLTRLSAGDYLMVLKRTGKR